MYVRTILFGYFVDLKIIMPAIFELGFVFNTESMRYVCTEHTSPYSYVRTYVKSDTNIFFKNDFFTQVRTVERSTVLHNYVLSVIM